jgi:hypothetical protein
LCPPVSAASPCSTGSFAKLIRRFLFHESQPSTRRFTFFDQIHTTGIDIKQSPTARAVVTIGKDMVFRDYAQGAYRMRGIGKGQCIHLYLVPEVISLVSQTLQSCSAETGLMI